MKIRSLYPNIFSGLLISHACLSITEAMRASGSDVDATAMGIASVKSGRRSYYQDAIPPWLRSLSYRLLSSERLLKITEHRFRSNLRDGDIAYLWPNVSLGLYEELQTSGFTIIHECINTHQHVAQRILSNEYRRLGLEQEGGITDRDIEDETAKIEIASCVYSPSPLVTASLIESGAFSEKILDSSYGLLPSECLQQLPSDPGSGDVTAVFVGRIGIRKGVHLLLDYWVRSGVAGKLILVGGIEAPARPLIEPYLSRSDIEHIEWIDDLRSVYRKADVFLLPSLEEGSPLVTYLTIGAGIPSIVSPMGAGGVIRDGLDGAVIEPHDEEKWINAICRAFEDESWRIAQGKNARQNAEHYLWGNVGARRIQQLREVIH